jgi:hypothetical protein
MQAESNHLALSLNRSIEADGATSKGETVAIAGADFDAE